MQLLFYFQELRLEDYAANRKGGAGSAVGLGFGTTPQQTGGLFGQNNAASTSAFSFGSTTQSKPMFGTTGATSKCCFCSFGFSFKALAVGSNALFTGEYKKCQILHISL